MSLEIIIFELKNDDKKWSRIYFEIHRAPSELPAKLPGQFGHSVQIFLHWAAVFRVLGVYNFAFNQIPDMSTSDFHLERIRLIRLCAKLEGRKGICGSAEFAKKGTYNF